MSDSARTVNGKKIYPGATKVVPFGHRGGDRPSKPQASQVAGQGAHDPGTGRKHAPGEYGNGTVARPGGAQSDSNGVSAEESRRRLASRMYPSSSGLRTQQKAGY